MNRVDQFDGLLSNLWSTRPGERGLLTHHVVMYSTHYRVVDAPCNGSSTDLRDWMTMATLPMTSMVSEIIFVLRSKFKDVK